MTLFAGLDQDHRRTPYWPTGLPFDAPLQVGDAWCEKKLRGFHTGGGRFRMRLDREFEFETVTDFSLRLDPVDTAQAAHIRLLRDRLAERLQIKGPDHDSYRFHITLAYLIRWLDPEESDVFRGLYRSWVNQIANAVPEFEIGPPVFCTFEDMHAFRPRLVLPD